MGIKKGIILLLSGVLIIGVSITSAIVELECQACDSKGILTCPMCMGSGAFLLLLLVECGCKGEKPDCPFCGGEGSYEGFYTFGMCEICEGKGGKPCLSCQGKGKIQLREKIPKFLRK